MINQIGLAGETLACEYLIKKGYRIIERNFRLRNGEIDIIAIESECIQTLVFFEVKTRTSEIFGSPLEAITYFKLKALIRSARIYTHLHPQLPKALRIDALALIVSPSGDLIHIEHVKNISG